MKRSEMFRHLLYLATLVVIVVSPIAGALLIVACLLGLDPEHRAGGSK